MNLKSFYAFLYVPNMIAIDLWPLDLVKSSFSVLHSFSSEGWQKFNWNYMILLKKKNHKAYVIDFKDLSGSNNLSGLKHLNRHDNLTDLKK